MAKEKFILVKTYCSHTQIEEGFMKTLHEYGLVTFEEKENDYFMNPSDITKIERMFRLHTELGINMEGLDALNNLLKRLLEMEKEVSILRGRLNLYE